MTLTVDYYFDLDFLPSKRHRRPRKVCLQDTYEAVIRTPSAEEFPTAFIVTEMKSRYLGAKTWKELEERHDGEYVPCSDEIRSMDGKLYKPVRISWGSAVSDQYEGLDHITDQLTNQHNPWTCNWYGAYDWDYWNSRTETMATISDTRDAMVKAIQEKADGFVFYDGKAWEQTGEPRYVVQTFGLGYNHGGTAAFIGYSYNDNIPAERYFNALRRKEAEEYGKMVALRRGDTRYADGMFDHIDIKVLMPEAVKVDPKSQHGDGDPFTNQIEALVCGSGSATEAGLLAIASTFAG